MYMSELQKKASAWFYELRDLICDNMIKLETGDNSFERTDWERNKNGGGGQISVMYGNIFEKIAVNVSTVYGDFDSSFSKEIPGCENSTKFWASGISLISHMRSPMIPAIHMNTRLIVTNKQWFGGGIDLTPIYYKNDDVCFFHSKLREICDEFNPLYYEDFSKKAEEYFYLKNRSEPRGVGGIFFDNLNSGDLESDFQFIKKIGLSFIDIYSHLVRRNVDISYSAEQRQYQLLKRGRYVEFNLLYDRGTRFGIMTGGNNDAIMSSLPPLVSWY